jgi:hypothetical protein
MLRGVTNSLPFAKLLGIEITEATPEKVTAEMMVRDELCTLPVLHGGAITWLGDKAGALGIHDPRDDVPSAEGGYLCRDTPAFGEAIRAPPHLDWRPCRGCGCADRRIPRAFRYTRDRKSSGHW